MCWAAEVWKHHHGGLGFEFRNRPGPRQLVSLEPCDNSTERLMLWHGDWLINHGGFIMLSGWLRLIQVDDSLGYFMFLQKGWWFKGWFRLISKLCGPSYPQQLGSRCGHCWCYLKWLVSPSVGPLINIWHRGHRPSSGNPQSWVGNLLRLLMVVSTTGKYLDKITFFC